MDGSGYFSDDYTTARERFRRQVAGAGGRLEPLRLAAVAPGGGELTIDIGWFGAATPRRAFLHVSGTHGVEAFAGSAVQLAAIDALPPFPGDVALVFVHVLNPWGMAWLRRVNENNVDLNRNFLGAGEAYRGHPEGYEAFYDLLNPRTLSRVDLFALRAGWLLARHGRPKLEAAIVAGQYDYPEGLFFGGAQFEQGPRLYTDFLSRCLDRTEQVFAVDVHTGLGPYAEDTLLVSDSDHERMRALLGERVEALGAGRGGVAYSIRGGHHEGVPRVLDHARVDFIGQEFGTYPPVRVLAALRRENCAHRQGDRSLDGPSKRRLKAVFCPPERAWRESVVRRGRALFERGLAILTAPAG